MVVLSYLYYYIFYFHHVLLQLPVRAFDRPILTQEDRSQVIINIQKDQFPPEFLGTPYIASGVSEIGSVGTIIYSGVTARDPDLKVKSHNVVQNSNMVNVKDVYFQFFLISSHF